MGDYNVDDYDYNSDDYDYNSDDYDYISDDYDYQKTKDIFVLEIYDNQYNSDKLLEVKCGGDTSEFDTLFFRVTPPFHVFVSSDKPKIDTSGGNGNSDIGVDFDNHDGIFDNEFKRALKRFEPISFLHKKADEAEV